MTYGKTFWRHLALCLAALAAMQSAAVYAKEAPGAPPGREILVMVRIAPDHYRPTGDYSGAYGDQAAQSAEDFGERTTLGNHLQKSILSGQQRLRPFALINIDIVWTTVHYNAETYLSG